MLYFDQRRSPSRCTILSFIKAMSSRWIVFSLQSVTTSVMSFIVTGPLSFKTSMIRSRRERCPPCVAETWSAGIATVRDGLVLRTRTCSTSARSKGFADRSVYERSVRCSEVISRRNTSRNPTTDSQSYKKWAAARNTPRCQTVHQPLEK